MLSIVEKMDEKGRRVAMEAIFMIRAGQGQVKAGCRREANAVSERVRVKGKR
jgi:hypothetical protein